MDGNVLHYIKQYINKNHVDVSSQEAMGICAFIAKDTEFSSYNAKEIRNGEADQVIELLIVQYREKLYGQIVDYKKLARYVERRLSLKYSFLYNLLSRDEIDACIKKSISNTVDLSEKDFSKYIKGDYDDIFIDGCKGVVELALSECYVSVSLVLRKANIKYHDNKYLISGTVCELLKDNTKEDIAYGFNDNLIIDTFKLYVKNLSEEIGRYVRKYLQKKELLFGIPIDKVVNYVIDEVIVKANLNPEYLFKRKYDAKIDKYADSVNTFNVKSNAKNYILNLIKGQSNGLISEDMIYSTAQDILEMLINSGHDLEKVVQGKYDKKLKEYIERKILLLSSIKEESEKSKSKDIEHKTRKRKMDIKALLLLLVTLLTIFLGIKGYKNLKSEIEYNQQLISLKEDYEFDHYYVFSDDNEFVSVDAENALNFYNSVDGTMIGASDYRYLGFYLAYLNTGQDRLYIMDEELSIAQSRCMFVSTYSSVSPEIQDYSCFLEFAMHRLYDMGYKEIKDPKYKEALDSYIYAMRNCGDEKPMNSDLISDEHKEVIEEIMEKYREYSRKLMEQYLEDKGFGESEDKLSELNSGNTGRKV